MAVSNIDLGKYKLGWADSTADYAFIPKKGLNEDIVREISGMKEEPEWMTKFRLNALVGSSRVDLQACKLEYSIVSPK